MTTDTIKRLGAEFHCAADSLADTLARLDNARLERMTFLRRCSKDSAARLGAIREELRTLPEQIAKWDAEAARLESQTAEDMLRQALETKGGDANATRDNGGARDGLSTSSYAQSGISPDGLQVDAPSVGKAEGEPYRAGLPPERLRKVWAEWEHIDGPIYEFQGSKYRWKQNPREQPWWDIGPEHTWSNRYRPHGATWARVEAMADEAEQEQVELCPIGSQAIYSAHAGARGRSVFALRGHWLGSAQRQGKTGSTFLDLTELPPGTVREASATVFSENLSLQMPTGTRFVIKEHASDGDVLVESLEARQMWVRRLQPVRVVKEGGEDAPR